MRPNTKNDEKTQKSQNSRLRGPVQAITKNLKKQTIYQLKCESLVGATRSMLNLRKPEHPPRKNADLVNNNSKFRRKRRKNLAKKLKESGKKTQGIWQKTQGI